MGWQSSGAVRGRARVPSAPGRANHQIDSQWRTFCVRELVFSEIRPGPHSCAVFDRIARIPATEWRGADFAAFRRIPLPVIRGTRPQEAPGLPATLGLAGGGELQGVVLRCVLEVV